MDVFLVSCLAVGIGNDVSRHSMHIEERRKQNKRTQNTVGKLHSTQQHHLLSFGAKMGRSHDSHRAESNVGYICFCGMGFTPLGFRLGFYDTKIFACLSLTEFGLAFRVHIFVGIISDVINMVMCGVL